MSRIEQAIAKLREAREKALAGPWASDSCGDVFTEAVTEYSEAYGQAAFRTIGTTKVFSKENAEAEFIALSANVWLAMVDVIDYARVSAGINTHWPIQQDLAKALSDLSVAVLGVE